MSFARRSYSRESPPSAPTSHPSHAHSHLDLLDFDSYYTYPHRPAQRQLLQHHPLFFLSPVPGALVAQIDYDEALGRVQDAGARPELSFHPNGEPALCWWSDARERRGGCGTGPE